MSRIDVRSGPIFTMCPAEVSLSHVDRSSRCDLWALRSGARAAEPVLQGRAANVP